MNRFETLMTVLMNAPQRFENACIQMLTQRSVDTAIGVQLDVLGKIVGQPRAGLTDDVYRRYIRARVATNRSTGRREDLIGIAKLVYGTPTTATFYEQDQISAWFIRVDNIITDSATMAALTSFMKSAIATGIRPVVQSAPAAAGGMFKFSGGTPGPGFGNVASPGTGGVLADIRDGN